jgi:hypothetical protein
VGLATDGTFLYWTDINKNNTYTYPSLYVSSTPANPGVVMMAPIAGGTPFMISWNWVAPEGIATDGTNVYWDDAQTGQIMKSAIVPSMDYMKLKIPTQISSDSFPPHAIAVSGGNVYWNDESGLIKTVPSSNTTSGTAKQLNDSTPPWGGSTPGGLAVDATNVYYADNSNVWQLPINSTTGHGLSLASAQDNPFGIAVDAHNVYWTQFNTGSAVGTDAIQQIPISGGSVVTVNPGVQDAIDIVVDSTSVYWNSPPSGTVAKAPIGGGATTTLATLPAAQTFTYVNVPLGLVVDSTSVYWVTSSSTNSGPGAIMKVAK